MPRPRMEAGRHDHCDRVPLAICARWPSGANSAFPDSGEISPLRWDCSRAMLPIAARTSEFVAAADPDLTFASPQRDGVRNARGRAPLRACARHGSLRSQRAVCSVHRLIAGAAQTGFGSPYGLCGMVRGQCTIPPRRGSPKPGSTPSLVLVELQPGNLLTMHPFSLLLGSLLLGISLFAASLVLSLTLLEGSKRRDSAKARSPSRGRRW